MTGREEVAVMDQDVNELPLGTANATTTVPGTIY